MTAGRRWTVQDRFGNAIYMTQERWEHITDAINHPEMAPYEEHLQETIRTGRRKQDQLNPQKYRYTQPFDDLFGDNTHLVVIVLFRFAQQESGELVGNNYVVTAYQKEIG
jgi:hypothetical protein